MFHACSPCGRAEAQQARGGESQEARPIVLVRRVELERRRLTRRNSSRSFRRDHGIANDIEFRRAEDFCEIESTDVPNQRGERRLEKVHSPRAWGCRGG